MENKTYRDLREAVIKNLEREDFNPNLKLGLLSFTVFVCYVFIFVFAIDLKFYWQLFIAFALGVMSEFLSITIHDILHGSVFKSKKFGLLFCIPLSTLTLISPSYWKYWHNYHHMVVDRWTHDEQPYEIGYETQGYPWLRRAIGPLELFIFKAMHLTYTQVKFLLDNRYKSKKHLDLKRNTAIQFLIIWLVKIYLFWMLPFYTWLALELVPLLVQNFISSVFLVTQHPQALKQENAINTYSISLPRWLEIYSLNLGYHIEHHLLAHLPSKNLPKVKNILQEHFRDFPQSRYSMIEALKKVYGIN